MGYTIPSTEEQINATLNDNFWNEHQDIVNSMRTLINAYHECIDVTFGSNQKDWYHELYQVSEHFGITNGKSEEELFPEKERTGKSFGDYFHALWNSISMYQELKQVNPELAEKTSVAKLHQNFSENYKQILIEKDMFDRLQELGRFKKYKGPKTYRPALIKLNLIQAEHKNDTPFTAKELEEIENETTILNLPFKQRKGVLKGEFSGSDIKTPADLQDYIDRYETMMRGFLNYGGNNLFDYAQKYAPEEGKTKKLSEYDLRVAADSVEYDNIITEESGVYIEYRNLEREAKRGIDLRNEINSVLNVFNEANTSAKNNLENDAELQNAEKAYKEEAKRCDKLYEYYYKIQNRSAGNRQFQKKLEDFFASINNNTVSLSKRFQQERQQVAATLENAAYNYKNRMEGNAKDIEAFRKEMGNEIEKISDRKDAHDDDPNASEYDWQQLKNDNKKLTEKVLAKTTEFKAFREKEKNKFEQSISKATEDMKKSYEAERADRLEAFKKATDGLKKVREDMANYYKSTASVANATQKVQNELKEVFDAMTSSKKFSFLGMGGNDSGKYTSMVDAVKNYLDGNGSAKDAHKACEEYLAKHSDAHGNLKDMSFGLGKLRKQGCVRMMEILSYDPMFKVNAAENDAVEAASKSSQPKSTEKNASDVQRTKVNYTTLKSQLAEKSAKIDATDKKKDAKAYSNLNKKIKKLRDKANADKEKSKKPIEKKNPTK